MSWSKTREKLHQIAKSKIQLSIEDVSRFDELYGISRCKVMCMRPEDDEFYLLYHGSRAVCEKFTDGFWSALNITGQI